MVDQLFSSTLSVLQYLKQLNNTDNLQQLQELALMYCSLFTRLHSIDAVAGFSLKEK